MSELTPITRNLVELSYHIGIPFYVLADPELTPEPVLQEYFRLMELEAEASKRK